MKIEQQVCTEQQAKGLKELGVLQTSIFFWLNRGKNSKLIYGESIEFLNVLPVSSAYSVAELGVMLGGYINNINLTENGYKGGVVDGNVSWMFVYDTEAQARAAMIIYLLENNLTTAAEVNERLNA